LGLILADVPEGFATLATLKLYPELSHEFIAGEGPATPQDYLVEGHVSEEVIRDIVRWIKSK
jgi:hypothetical protein